MLFLWPQLLIILRRSRPQEDDWAQVEQKESLSGVKRTKKNWKLQDQSTIVFSRTICCLLSESGLHGRRPRKSPLWNRNRNTSSHVDKPQCFWKNVLWADETKLIFWKVRSSHRRNYHTFKEKKTIPTVRHVRDSVRLKKPKLTVRRRHPSHQRELK